MRKPVVNSRGVAMVDPIRWQPLVVCWTLTSAGDADQELPEMSRETRYLIRAEEILWFSYTQHLSKYLQFQNRA